MALRRPAAIVRRPGRGRGDPPDARGGDVRRRPAAAGDPEGAAGRAAPLGAEGRKEEVGREFESGVLVPCHQVPIEVLRKRLAIEASGIYWGQSGGVSGLVQGIHVRSREDVELEVVLQATNLESILKWASGSEDKLMRIHLCGTKCPTPLEADNYLHGEFIRARTGEDLPWMMNLVAEVREERQEHPAQPPTEKGRKEEKKKKKEKDRGRSKEKDRSRKRKRRKSSGTRSRSSAGKKRISLRGEAKKELQAVFGGTGIDPDPKFRRRFTAKAAKRVKKRWKDTSSSSSSRTKSEASSEKSVELFAEEQKIRRMGRAAPGALTCAAFRNIQHSLLTGTGGVWNPEEGVIPPIACQYYRQCMQQRLQGGQAREALTVAWTLDLLLQGRVSEACDTLSQRLKSLEMSGERIELGGGCTSLLCRSSTPQGVTKSQYWRGRSFMGHLSEGGASAARETSAQLPPGDERGNTREPRGAKDTERGRPAKRERTEGKVERRKERARRAKRRARARERRSSREGLRSYEIGL